MHHLELQIYLGQLVQITNFWALTIFCARRQQQTHTPDRQQNFSRRLSGKWQQCISPGATGSRENVEYA